MNNYYNMNDQIIYLINTSKTCAPQGHNIFFREMKWNYKRALYSVLLSNLTRYIITRNNKNKNTAGFFFSKIYNGNFVYNLLTTTKV